MIIAFAFHTKKIALSISLVNVDKSARNCGFFTFTKEGLNGKLHFFCEYWLFTTFEKAPLVF